MREIFIFAIGASVAGTVFLVSLVELFFTIRRRKVQEHLREKIIEIKANYNKSINELVLDGEAKLAEADKKIEDAHAEVEQQKEATTAQFQEELKKVEASSEHEVELAKARAKKLEQEAKLKAEEYLETRKTEVEQELMNLVMSVTKKVLPEGIAYDVQKDLVLKALRDAKTGNGNDDK